VKLSVHAMKAYTGSGGIAPLILNFGSSGGEWLASSPDRMTLNRILFGSRSLSGRTGKEKSLFPDSIRTPHCVARILVTIQGELLGTSRS